MNLSAMFIFAARNFHFPAILWNEQLMP